MQFQLPLDISERLQFHIAGGNYRSEDEVLRDALDALDQREQNKLQRWNDANAIAVEQSRQGLSTPLDDEAVLKRLRERLAAQGISD